MTELTSQQKAVIVGIIEWFKKAVKQKVSLVGFAGTGKTFLIGFIIKKLKLKKNEVAFCAYTGKAALVLKNRVGFYETSTIHKLIYEVRMVNNVPVFELKKVLYGIKLIIVDESSMVSKEIYDDLMSFGIPVVFVGDEGQLPSIGEKFNVLENPDFRLTEIHRQAADNPVIHLSMLARTGEIIKPGKYGDTVFVFKKGTIKQEVIEGLYSRSDQIICGLNNTRHTINTRMREILGYESDLPIIGDKLICLKNSWGDIAQDTPLINGMTGYVKATMTKAEMEARKKKKIKDIPNLTGRVKFNPVKKEKKETFRNYFGLDFGADFSDDALYQNLQVLTSDFIKNEEPKLQNWEYRLYNSFDYGYAITCHKSQGSQFENVYLKNEILDFQTHKQWLYTGVTRTEKNLILELD
jgi:exodeoxyribonuclease-5